MPVCKRPVQVSANRWTHLTLELMQTVRPRRPHVATLNEVEITRENEVAVIRFLNPEVATTHLRIGPEVQHMTNEEVLARFNECVMAQEELDGHIITLPWRFLQAGRRSATHPGPINGFRGVMF